MSEIILNDKNFEEEIINSEIPCVVDFWAPWCGPCKMMGPVIEELAKEYEGKVKVAKLNVDDHPDTSAKYNVMSIPTVIFFNKGAKVDQSIGFVPKDSLKKKIDSML